MKKKSRAEIAAKVQENLEKINENEPPVKCNIDKDRKIVFIPAEDFSGISAYFYGDGLNTARIGLSTRAAILLSDGIIKMLRENKEFLEELQEKK